jgi:RNA binding exosome subunit
MDFEKLPPFSAADVRIIIHATEDKNKVLESICGIFRIDADRFRHTELIGHWGNRISLLTGNLESAEANRLVKKILLSLSSVEKNQLSSASHSFIDEKGNLYLRLDKQRICQKRISLSDTDSIRFKFKPARRFKANSNCDYLAGD